MLLTVFNVFYILVAVAMIALILLQRGAGADAGSGFGGGASATVFGARGSASFLSRTTAVLAALFFILSLGMGIYFGVSGGVRKPTDDLGIMSRAGTPAVTAPATPPPVGDVPPPPAVAAPPDAPPMAPKSDIPPAADKDGKAEVKPDEAKKNE